MSEREKKMEPLQIEEYSNGLILPRKETASGPMWGLGGVCDEKNQFVQSSYYDGGWATHGGAYPWDDETYVDEDAVYVGMFYLHWGHFLIDLTNRYWALPMLQKRNKYLKVAYIGEEEPGENHLRFFELLGIQKEQLIHIQKPTRFRRVYVPQQGFKSCSWYTDEYLQMLNGMVKNALVSNQDFSEMEKADKVYFSRRSFSKAVCSEFGEEYFQSVFEENGFTVFAPETLTLDQQIYLWNHASEIVCMNGTIPLNVMFCCNPCLELTILNKTSIFHENPVVLLKMRGVSARFVDIYREPLKSYPKSLGSGPFLLWPTLDFCQYCDEKTLRVNLSPAKEKKYFRIQTLRYYWAVLGIVPKLRLFVSKIAPDWMKRMHRLLHYTS